MCPESPAHVWPEEKSMGRSGHRNTTPITERITCLQEREGLTLPTWNFELPQASHDLDARQVNQRGERSRIGWYEIRGTIISVVVGVRVLRTLDFINYLHTQLFHNHPKLVTFDRRNARQTWKVVGIEGTGGDLLLQQGKTVKKNDNKPQNKIKKTNGIKV